MTSWNASSVVAERTLRRKIRSSLGDWAEFALAQYGHSPARHHLLLIRELEALAAGQFDRLMFLLPPGSAKSTYTSQLFPAWFLAKYPDSQVIAASHTEGLARHFGRIVRGLMDEHSQRLGASPERGNRAAGRFGVVGGGSYFATGVRGPVTGRRADLVIIDDPVKNQAEADSAAARDQLWNWFRSDLVTRLKPGGRVALAMTRWHPDDLAGRLLSTSEEWRVVRLPALAEAGDLLGRKPGEALWPQWEDAAALERKRQVLGDRTFEALFQQSPSLAGGRLFKTDRLRVVEERAAGTSARAWDLAASEGGGDWTAGVLLTRTAEGGYQVGNVIRLQGGPEAVLALIVRTAEDDGREVRIGLPQDPGQAGRSQVAFMTKRLAGWRVVSSPESGSKGVRAMPMASQVNAGTVTILSGSWNRAFIEELQDFPFAAKDDQVDALSRAFDMLVSGGTASVKAARLDWFIR